MPTADRPIPDPAGEAGTPLPCWPCGLPGCGVVITWDPGRSPTENRCRRYCCREHHREHELARKAAKMRASRARRATDRPGPADGEPADLAPLGPPPDGDRCDEEVARLRAVWEPLGFDVRPRILPAGVDRRGRELRRVVSDLVAGLPPGVPWSEVERRRRRLAARQGASGGRDDPGTVNDTSPDREGRKGHLCASGEAPPVAGP